MQEMIFSLQIKLDAIKNIETSTPIHHGEFMMTRKEAAAFIGRSVRQLDRLCETYKIKKEVVDGSIRIRRTSLLRFQGIISEEIKPMSEIESVINRYK